MQQAILRLALVGLAFSPTLALAQSASSGTGAVGVAEESVHAAPYYGLAMDFTVADGSGLNAVGQNYRNDLSFYFEPTWNIGAKWLAKTRMKGLALAARFIVTQNLSGTDEANFTGNTQTGAQGTCSDITPGEGGLIDPTQVKRCNPKSATRRTDYSDFWLTLRAPKIATIPKINVHINPSFRAVFPTSVESRYQSLQASITPGLGFSGSWWKDRIRLGYSVSVTKFFFKYNTPGVRPTGGEAVGQGGNPWDGFQGTGVSNFYQDPSRLGQYGLTNPNFSVAQVFSSGVQFHKQVGLDVLYIYSMVYGLPTGDCLQTIQGQLVDLCRNGDAVAANSGSTLNRPGRRDSQVLWISLNYNPFDWMGLTLSWINWAPAQLPNSKYRQGFISTDYNAFTTVQLGMTFTIDAVATAVRERLKKNSTQNQAALTGRNLW